VDSGLTRRGLSASALNYLPHNNFVDVLRVEPGPLDGLLNGQSAKLWRRKIDQTAVQHTNSRAAGRDNVRVTSFSHVSISSEVELLKWVI
jgi:hypothetical protein